MIKFLKIIRRYRKQFTYVAILFATLFSLLFGKQFISNDNKASEDKININNISPNINNQNQLFDKNIYSVTSVIDGDTIDVDISGRKEKIRFIGINTPETVDPRRTVECFGKEASSKTTEMLSGKKVYLQNDSTQSDKDKYNRLLRYIFLEDGTNVNYWLVQNGYAYEYTYDLPYKYQAEFKKAQKEAQASKVGLWASGVCGN